MHIFWKWQALGSASIGSQQINTVLERYWFQIANQHINRIWTHTYILAIAALGSSCTANQQINAVRRPIGSKFYFSTIANQQINRVWTHTHILAMAALLDSASTANQRINSVLENYWFKISLSHYC